MRTKKAVWNIISALGLQLVTVVCGFILPRAILGAFGSDTNGLVSSASQFLGYITLLESGVGGVTRAALYGPLERKDKAEINGILKATENFFRKIAVIFVVYVAILTFAFPKFVDSDKSSLFIAGIVLVVAISTFVQYYFGVTYSVFLQADQKSYISNVVTLTTTLANTVLSLVLIYCGFGIHVVKLGTAFVFIIRPIFYNLYVKRKYGVNLNCEPDNTAIKNRWNGLGQHIAYFLHSNTDIVVLTIFMNVKEVSVYSIYLMITTGVTKLVNVVSSGLEAGFGSLIASGEKESLNRVFRIYEVLISVVATTLFITAAFLFLPFIAIYTNGIEDANYFRPVVMALMIASEMIYCFRLPYNSVTLAAGHYKETQMAAYIEAGLNISLSLGLVIKFGMAGVVSATILAMLFRLCHFGWYLSVHILERRISVFFKRMAVNIFIVAVLIAADSFLPAVTVTSYGTFVIEGCILVTVNLIISITINAILYLDDMKGLTMRIKAFVHRV